MNDGAARRLAGLLALSAMLSACGDSGDGGTTDPETPRPTTVAVSPSVATLDSPGDTVRLAAQVRDQNGQLMPDVSVTWSSGDVSAATVDGSGLVTGVGEGTAAITAEAQDASGSAQVTVNAAPTVDPTVQALAEDDAVEAWTARVAAAAPGLDAALEDVAQAAAAGDAASARAAAGEARDIVGAALESAVGESRVLLTALDLVLISVEAALDAP